MNSANASPRSTSIGFLHDVAEGAITLAQLLRMFDDARRDLASNVTGTEGVGAGYGAMQFDTAAIDDLQTGDLITVTAVLRDVRRQCHVVDYVATATPPQAETHIERRVAELVRARGWTAAVATPRSVPSDQARGPL